MNQIQEKKIHRGSRYSAGVRGAIVLFILASLLYIMLPKEIFDPHVGIEYDIYCIVYTLLSCVSIHSPQKPVRRIFYSVPLWGFVISVYPAEVVPFREIRAPPVIFTLYVAA